MSKIFTILIFLVWIFFLSGCGDIVNIGGIFLNRANSSNSVETQLIFLIKNNEGQLLQNFTVTIRDPLTGRILSPAKFTSANKPVVFNFPDELGWDILNENGQISAEIFYPELFYELKIMNVAEINRKIFVVEINTGYISADLPKKDLYYYYKNEGFYH